MGSHNNYNYIKIYVYYIKIILYPIILTVILRYMYIILKVYYVKIILKYMYILKQLCVLWDPMLHDCTACTVS